MTRILGRRRAGPLAAVLCCAVALAVGSPGAGSAATGRAGGAAAPAGLAGSAGSAGMVSQPVAGPGTNLLLNPGAQAGAASADGWDAVTIPGWQVSSGLPTVVPYGAPHLSPATGQGPAVPGGSLFAGGAGGTARLTQAVSLRQAAGPPVATGTRYQFSGWLGGTATSQAAVTVAFLSATGAVLARRAISHGRGNDRLAYRAAAGTLPSGTASARVTLVLATSLTNDDGPNAPLVGYDRAVADSLRFSVSAPVRRLAPLTPPAAHVPRYQHVFLFYFENEDLGAVLGNTKQAPFLNSLVPHSSVLANFFAEEHPSDANYLALAGGSAFGVPLTDPLELNPQYTIHARNIGDLISARHETWKTYPQSANGPCDDTVHKYYWNDDQPMTYFADVRGRPAYCAAHLLPLPALRTDLASAATTPNFAWPAPDDCADMEGCGIKAGDQFLQAELGAIMRSPAWRTQRSLAIITFDEDGYDHEHPAQRVLTLMLGSGVRQGYVSHVRYTHYSLLRTIEAALGLGTLTRNDRYAQPVNDVFSPGPAAPAPAVGAAAAPAPGVGQAPVGGTPMATGTRAAPARALTAPRHPTAFVANSGGTVTPIGLTTHRPASRSRSARTRRRSPSRRTAVPPSSPTTARTRSRRSVQPPAVPARPSRPGRPGRPGAQLARRHTRQHEGLRRRRRLRHRDRHHGGHGAGRPRHPGGILAGRGRHLPVGRDGVRGEHDLRDADAGQHRDRRGRPPDQDRHLHLSHRRRAHAVRRHRGGGRHLRRPGHPGQHPQPQGHRPGHGRPLPGRRRHRWVTGPAPVDGAGHRRRSQSRPPAPRDARADGGREDPAHGLRFRHRQPFQPALR
jgi:Phosphoesterase family